MRDVAVLSGMQPAKMPGYWVEIDPRFQLGVHGVLRIGLFGIALLAAFVALAPASFAQGLSRKVSQAVPAGVKAVVSGVTADNAATNPVETAELQTASGTDPLDAGSEVASGAPLTAADATLAMATLLDGAGGGVSGDELMSALQGAADAGQPMALWRLGVMYEKGEGVKKDQAKAFAYFSRIANEHANTPPRSLEADIVAQSFLKVGEYYKEGLPVAGIKIDRARSNALLLHAATYFGDADAQYQVGEMYLSKDSAEHNVLQGARWLSLAARKGQIAAQATLGNLLFNGNGIAPQPIEGLMWLIIAHDHSTGAPEHDWIEDLLNKAMSTATPEERTAALNAAQVLGPEFSGG